MELLSRSDIDAARDRIAHVVRPLSVAHFAPTEVMSHLSPQVSVSMALEFLQFSGSFKARGAANFMLEHASRGTLPDGGVAIASGGNAGLAFAWAAGLVGAKVNAFVPETTPPTKLERLSELGAIVHRVGDDYGDAVSASREYAERNGVLLAHAYDDRLMAAGAGTLLADIRDAVPDVTTVVVAVGGGGLFSGVATAASAHGVNTVAVEPYHSRALHAALETGRLVDVPVTSIAKDSLGARRASATALQTAQLLDTQCVLVDDGTIAAARQLLWNECRIAVEYGAAAPLAALLASPPAYVPAPGESVCLVLCGANTGPVAAGGSL